MLVAEGGRTMRNVAALLTLLGAVGPAPSPAQVAAAASAGSVSIADAAWLTGCWRMAAGRHEMEEQWMAPAGDAMLGMNRSLRDGEFRGYELLILTTRDGRLVYEAHPSGQQPAEFVSTTVDETELVFENPSHDFPQRLEYRLAGPDSIMVEVFAAVADGEPAFTVPLARIACGGTALPPAAPPDSVELRGTANYITAYPAIVREGIVNAVIEIPAGTNEKWEVVEPGSVLEWEIAEGERRVVGYLAYPANYGMIPRTLLAKEAGGDGDPLDIIVLGPAQPRGSVVAARPVGLLRLLDDGERDDKIIAVRAAGPLSDATTLQDLDALYPGATEIIRIWFTSYKGPGRLESSGYQDEAAAMAVIREAAAMFESARDETNAGH
jgi:inorganic pyrophosphatase